MGEPLVVDDLAAEPARRRLAEAEVLVTSWGCPPLDGAVLAGAPKLRAVLHAAGSVRSHVGEAVFDRGILVTTAAEADAGPVARYTLAAILWAFKKVPFLAADARTHRQDWSYLTGRGELSGRDRTVVLVGFSRVGRRVAALLRALELAEVLAVDPVVDPAEVAAAGATLVPLAGALPRADVLSLHAPLLPAAHHLIGAAELAALPPHAVLINTARGGLVDTAASVLYDLPNVVITPHVAGSLGSETRRLSGAALTELERHAAGLAPLDPVTHQSFRISA